MEIVKIEVNIPKIIEFNNTRDEEVPKKRS